MPKTRFDLPVDLPETEATKIDEVKGRRKKTSLTPLLQRRRLQATRRKKAPLVPLLQRRKSTRRKIEAV